MLWSLLVSGYIIYLYRKLNAEGKPEAAPSGGSGTSAIESELAKLSERIGALESRVSSTRTQERAS